MSAPVPGVYGTIRWIGRLGYSCAKVNALKKAAAKKAGMRVMAFSWVAWSL
jgi:hypothetical protein